MAKEGVIFSLDRGFSMLVPGQQSSPFQLSLQAINISLQQRIFSNAACQCALAIFGDEDCQKEGDGNNLLLSQLQKPGLQLIRDVGRMKNLRPSEKQGGDLFESLHFCANELGQNYGGNKKVSKRIFLFTAGKGSTQSDEQDIQMLASNICKADIKVNVVCFNFMDNYDPQQNRLESSSKDQIAQKNSLLLVLLKQNAPENVQILPAGIAMDLYRKFRKPEKASRPTFRDDLKIGSLSIGVAVYKYVRQNKLTSLKKYSTKADYSPATGTGLVGSDSVFYKQDDPTMEPVEQEHQAKGYLYGKNIVPISSVMQDGMKITEEKGMKLLGFVQSKKIPRHSFMGDVDLVVPVDDPHSKKLFSALLFSMISTKKYALVRYVSRKNSRGVSPKLMALIPYKSQKGEYFYLVQMPTAQDVRQFQFSSLLQATPNQEAAVSKLIDSMSLVEQHEGQKVDNFKVKHTINPTRQYFFQSIFHRALTDETDLPPLDPAIQEYLHPQRKFSEKVKNLLAQVRQLFKLKVKESAAKKATVALKQLVLKMQKPQLDLEQTQDVPIHKIKMFQDQPKHKILPPLDPLPTFRKMVTDRSEDLVVNAMEQLQALISKIVQSGLEDHLRKGVQWILQLRRVAVQEQQAQTFDKWLKRLWEERKEHQFIERLRKNGIGFIKLDNREIFSAQGELKKVAQVLQVQELD